MSITSEGTGDDHRNQRIQIHKYHHQRFKSLCAYIIGRSEKPKSWKSKNEQADNLPRHSPDVRTVFEI